MSIAPLLPSIAPGAVAETNPFGNTVCRAAPVGGHMDRIDETVDDTLRGMAAPDDRPRERMDARDLPPPEPLTNTLERLAELDDGSLLVQVNDRAPRHLYPKLEDRGYRYETAELEDRTVTAIWTDG